MTIMASQIAGQLFVQQFVQINNKRTSKVHITVPLRGIHWWPVVSLHKGTVTQKMFPFFYAIMLKYEKTDIIAVHLKIFMHTIGI